MKRFHSLSTLILGGALACGSLALAQQQPIQEHSKTTTTTTTEEKTRVIDPATKQYHEWNSNEDKAYRMYLKEQNREYVEYPKVKVTEQTQYWKWRHDHPDSVIFKTETREEVK